MIRMRSSTNRTENSQVGSLVTILIISMKYKPETFTFFVQMSWRALPDRCQQRNSGEDIAIRLTWRNLLLTESRNGKPDGIQGKITVNEQVTIIKERHF